MALYKITLQLNSVEVANVQRQTKVAAHAAAYRLWYEYLGISAGRDTHWGWRGVDRLRDWLDTNMFSVSIEGRYPNDRLLLTKVEPAI